MFVAKQAIFNGGGGKKGGGGASSSPEKVPSALHLSIILLCLQMNLEISL